MAEFGLTPEDYAADEFEVWPDNVDSLRVFIAMRTQWNWVSILGAGGAAIARPSGLKYEALQGVMRMIGIPAADRSSVFEDIQIMEDVAMEQMRK